MGWCSVYWVTFETKGERPLKNQNKKQTDVHKGDFLLHKKDLEVMNRILIIQRYTVQTRGLSGLLPGECVCVRESELA